VDDDSLLRVPPGDRARAYLAWYRPAVLSQLVRIALLSAVIMCAGMAALGLGLWSPRIVASARPILISAGGLATVFGPVSMIVRFHRLLMREDGYLGVRADGVDIHLSGPATFVAWDDLIGVGLGTAAAGGGEGPIELRLRSGEVLRLEQEWSGSTRAQVARELETTRKRAGLGLIRR
jgi:hypothetical protein